MTPTWGNAIFAVVLITLVVLFFLAFQPAPGVYDPPEDGS